MREKVPESIPVEADRASRSSWRRDAIAGAAFLLSYLVAWWLATGASAPDGVRGFWQPAPAIAIAFLVLEGTHLAPVVLLGSLLSAAIGPIADPFTAIASAVLGTVAAATAAALIRRTTRAGAAPPAAAIALAAIFVPDAHHTLLALISPAVDFVDALRESMGESAAALAVLPFVFAFRHWIPGQPRADRTGPSILEWIGLAVMIAAIAVVDLHPATDDVRTSYLFLVPVAWAGLRYGTGAVAGAVLLTNLFYVAAIEVMVPLDTAAAFQSLLMGVNLAALLIAAVAGAKSHVQDLLRERDRFYRLVADHSTDVIVVIREDGVCEYASPSLLSVFGWRPDEIIGTRFGDLIHGDDLSRTLQDFARTFRREQLPPSPLRIRRADGEYLWAERTARAFDDPADAGHSKLVAVVRDISERQNLEDSLRQSQKLESVGRLAGGIAHDFNNLLTAILGHASLLQEDERLPVDVHGQVDEMRKAAERAAALTGQLLAFARRQVTDPKVVDVNELVGGMERLLHRVLGDHIRLRTDLARGLPRVRIDPGQMEQVLMNLAVNGRDAMPGGGRLIMRTAFRNGGGAFDPESGLGDHVEIAVTDTGQGMTPETRARLFEPFFTTKAVGKGTGLGLAVCDGIIRQAGGRIDVDTAVGKGTTFTIRLPLCAEDALGETITPSRPQLGAGEGESVLVVEDETQVRELIVKVLRADGYRVITAQTAEDALELLTRDAILVDALITDVLLPGMSGPKLAETVRERFPHARILFMSGFVDSDLDAERAGWAPGGFLSKPFSPETLRSRVRDLLDNNLTQATGLARLPRALHGPPAALTLPPGAK